MQANYIDPFSIWKSFYTEMEPKMSQSMQKWLESEEYAAFSGQLMNVTLMMEQHFKKSVEAMLQRHSLPTVQDIARVCELVIGLESKVDAVDERLIQLEKLALNTTDLREQINLIVSQLEAIRTSLPTMEATAATTENSDSQNRNNRKRTQKSDESVEQPKPEKLV